MDAIDEIRHNCIHKWAPDEKLDKKLDFFNKKFSSWVDQIPLEYRSTALTIINQMFYYTKKQANGLLVEIHQKVIALDNVNEDNTIYTFIKSADGISNSSNDYWTEYKAINHINNNLCFENIDAINDWQWEKIQNIVFIDDFSGSGKSFIKALENSKQRFQGKTVIFVTVSIMNSAKSNIETYGKDNSIEIIVLSGDTHEGVFENKVFDDAEEARSTIRKMSCFFHIPWKEHFGFSYKGKPSEAAVAFYNNTPNNTLGFIRCDVENCYFSLFPRVKDPKPAWQKMSSQVIKNKNKRKGNNLNNLYQEREK